MTLYISIVNHNHDDLICSNENLIEIANQHSVVIKSNTTASDHLINFCITNKIVLLQGNTIKGFGENNNDVFQHIKSKSNPEKDFFLILNPDVFISLQNINELLRQVERYNSDISAINLFKDSEKKTFDNSIRYFPNLLNPIKSLLNIKRNDFYDKSMIKNPHNIDWAAGSFLLIRCNVFQKLEGFDSRYFMYYEDADLCRRAHKLGFTVKYFPEITAIHLAQHQNRKILSKHFYYYCCSFIRYFLKS